MAMAPSWSNIGGGPTDLYNVSTKTLYNRQVKNETDVRFRQTKVKGVSPTGQQSIAQPVAMQVLSFPQEFSLATKCFTIVKFVLTKVLPRVNFAYK